MKKITSAIATSALLASLLLVSTTASAVPNQVGKGESAGNETLESFIRGKLDNRFRAEIVFGDLPDGTRLAPCQKIQPYLPPGTRLWGHARIGVRCLAGANWRISLPVEVKVFGKVLIANKPMRARKELDPSDFELRELDLTKIAGTPVTDPGVVNGKMMSRNIRAGQTLMSYHMRTQPTVARGDPVSVRITGRGFNIVVNGSAMAPGTEGQPLRVRTDAGKVIVGNLNGRTVVIPM